MSVGVIIPAGGTGKRMGSKREKQFLKVGNRTILEITLAKFNSHPDIDEIVLVLPRARVRSLGAALKRQFKKISRIVQGGKKRTQSVINGFHAFEKRHAIILIHDSVRPFIDRATISKTIRASRKFDAVTVAVPAKDTIKIVDKTRILGTPKRQNLWYTQTPQGFKYNVLKEALSDAVVYGKWETDECQLAEQPGKRVHVVKGNYLNFKITTKEDLLFARSMILKP
jgi:2-C-methyl-D-erythritol 4-phosphate cytidylyltransferase